MLAVTLLHQCVALLEPLPLVVKNDFSLQESAAGMVWDMHAHLQHTAQRWHGMSDDIEGLFCTACCN